MGADFASGCQIGSNEIRRTHCKGHEWVHLSAWRVIVSRARFGASVVVVWVLGSGSLGGESFVCEGVSTIPSGDEDVVLMMRYGDECRMIPFAFAIKHVVR